VERAERQALQRDLVALADGDRGAFHPIFVRLWPLVRGFAARALDPQDADDVAQEALLRVFARASAFDRERDALSWVLGIAAYEIRSARKRRTRRREAPERDLAERPTPSPSPEEVALRADLERALEAALALLPSADATTLVAYARGERPALPSPTFRKRVVGLENRTWTRLSRSSVWSGAPGWSTSSGVRPGLCAGARRPVGSPGWVSSVASIRSRRPSAFSASR
jgi:RNA polymerase sigma-70 factor (ECF subfamily)